MTLPIRGKKKGPSHADKYFRANKGLKFFSTGGELLDQALGGGYPLGRIVNIVGDKSTGKTLLAIEACANFAMQFPRGMIRYKEAEAAFDKNYAALLGLPVNRVELEEEFDTVEELEKDLKDYCTRVSKKKVPGLYILDSLDALSDKAEQKRNIEDGTYGASKAKLMSELFRRNKRTLQKSKVTVIIISQVRDKLNAAAFGRKWTRSGGRALDFYASQVIYLAEIKKLQKTSRGIKRSYGVVIRAKVMKNKVGIPFREADFTLIFGYGIDDIQTNLDWLKATKSLKAVGLKETAQLGREVKRIKALPRRDRNVEVEKLREAVRTVWREVEIDFLPSERKY